MVLAVSAGVDLQALFANHRSLLGSYAERIISAEAGGEAAPVADYFASATLAAAIDAAARRWGASDRQSAASVWLKHYSAAIVSGPLVALAVARIGIIPSWGETRLALRDGLPYALVLSEADTAWPDMNDLAGQRAAVFTRIMHDNLALVVEQVRALTGLGQRIMWGNVANLCADIYDRLETDSRTAVAGAADRAALLGTPLALTGASPNPLRAGVRYASIAVDGDGTAHRMRIRTTCCLRHRLADATPCYTCPQLGDAERCVLLRQHGLI